MRRRRGGKVRWMQGLMEEGEEGAKGEWRGKGAGECVRRRWHGGKAALPRRRRVWRVLVQRRGGGRA